MIEFLQSLSFRYPLVLLFLVLVPAYLIWYLGWYHPRRLRIKLSYDPQKLKGGRPPLGFVRFLPLTLQLIAISAMVIALARPQTALNVVSRNAEGIDIMLLLDTSSSMTIPDMEMDSIPRDTTRLAVAKATATQFVNGRHDDRIGIVLFAAEAYSYVPRTLDYGMLEERIEDIESKKMIDNSRTAMGSAIMIGILRLQKSEAPSKVMVLLTDGVNTAGEIKPVPAARLAAENGIKIYSIGVGGRLRGGASPGPGLPQSELDEETLEKVAGLTEGKYYYAGDETALEEVWDEISQLEKTEVEVQQQKLVQDQYPPLLILALICLTAAFLLMALMYYNPLEE